MSRAEIAAAIVPRVRSVARGAGGLAASTLSALWASRAEMLVAMAFLAGWVLLTIGVASYTSAKVWPLSIGLLLLSLCGWNFVRIVAWKGLYRLIEEASTRE